MFCVATLELRPPKTSPWTNASGATSFCDTPERMRFAMMEACNAGCSPSAERDDPT
jgi:hypothetical protein